MTAALPSPDSVAAVLAAVRRDPPLVQCLTNTVVQNWTANVLLAVGAVPAMVDNPQESQLFAGVADGVLVNLGTPQETTVEAMRGAVGGAVAAGTPWILDPVAAGGLPWRTAVALELLERRPTIVRGNASEVLGIAGGAGGRGPDSSDRPETALAPARELATAHATVLAVSGEIDHVTDGDRVARVSGGHPWLTRVTGVGCSLGALMAAFAARCDDPLVAAVAATSTLTVTGAEAAAASGGPGSFAVALLDGLATVEPDRLADQAQIS